MIFAAAPVNFFDAEEVDSSTGSGLAGLTTGAVCAEVDEDFGMLADLRSNK